MHASTISLHIIFPQRLATLITIVACVIAVGVRGTEDAPQMSTTKITHIALHSVSHERRSIPSNLFNSALLTACMQGKTASASKVSRAYKRRKTVKLPARNGYHGLSTVLYGPYDADRTEKRRSDKSAFSEASSFNELGRGVSEANGTWSLVKPLSQSSPGMNSLVTDNLKDPLKPPQGRQWKTQNLRRHCPLKTVPCNCLIHKIPLTYIPHQPMNSHYNRRKLWLFVEYCNKCISFMNFYKLVYGTYVTYQICYSCAKCTAYSQITIRDDVDSENYTDSRMNKVNFEEITSCKENSNTWSRFRRELNKKEESNTVDDTRISSELEMSALTNQTYTKETVTSLRDDTLDSTEQNVAPENVTEYSGLPCFQKRRGFISNSINFVRTAGHSIGAMTASVLGTVVSSIMKQVGDEEVTDSVRDVLAGLGRAVSGASAIGRRVAEAIF